MQGDQKKLRYSEMVNCEAPGESALHDSEKHFMSTYSGLVIFCNILVQTKKIDFFRNRNCTVLINVVGSELSMFM